MTDDLITVLGILGFFYTLALLMACMELNIEHDVPLQGLFWRALPQPFTWLWQLSQRIGLFFGPPPKAPRRTRLQMQRRIVELERELGIESED